MELYRVADGVYYSNKDDEYDQPCLFAIAGSKRTLMVDGGVTPERAQEFVSLLRRETGHGVDFAAVTHWHWDHTFGLAGIDAPVIACANTARHITRMLSYDSWSDEAMYQRILAGEEIEVCARHIKMSYPGDQRGRITIRRPDIVFERALELDLGGLTCRLTLLPPVHTNDCVAIHVPERDALILGDCIYANSYDRPAHYSARPVLDMLGFIQASGAALLLESHVGTETPEEFWRYARMLEAAAQGVLAGIGDAPSLLARMVRECEALHEDAEEIAELFIAGIEYDRQVGGL